jgi:hypothetical protein
MKRLSTQKPPRGEACSLRAGLKTRGAGEIQRAFVDEITPPCRECELSMAGLTAAGVVPG